MTRLIVVAVLVFAALSLSAVAFAKERDWRSLIQLTGAAFLLIVVLAHFFEMFHLLPQMGWGSPTSPGHYLDLGSAIAGIGLFASGYIARKLTPRKS